MMAKNNSARHTISANWNDKPNLGNEKQKPDPRRVDLQKVLGDPGRSVSLQSPTDGSKESAAKLYSKNFRLGLFAN
jgi:hypothetical protein